MHDIGSVVALHEFSVGGLIGDIESFELAWEVKFLFCYISGENSVGSELFAKFMDERYADLSLASGNHYTIVSPSFFEIAVCSIVSALDTK